MPANLPLFPNPDTPRPAGPKIGRYIDRPDSFFLSSEGKQFVDNLVGWQNPNGGWFKNFSYLRPRPAELEDNPNSGPPGDDDQVWHQVSTFDNGGTYSEMRVLARAYRVLKEPSYRASFDRALNYCFAAQYPNGGWPQRYPLQSNYGARITFNDGAMTGVMAVLRDIVERKPDFGFCTDAQRQQAKEAFDRGVNCILKCQYVQNGKLTVWGQQHDERTFAPASGRAYELAGLTANESADILELLEGIKNPNERIRNSIEAAYAWYESSKILGKRIDFVPGVGRTMVDDPTAPPLWARCYDPETNRPFVAGRDGVARLDLNNSRPNAAMATTGSAAQAAAKRKKTIRLGRRDSRHRNPPPSRPSKSFAVQRLTNNQSSLRRPLTLSKCNVNSCKSCVAGGLKEFAPCPRSSRP